MEKEIILAQPTKPSINREELALLSKELTNVREEVMDNPYIKEALRVLPTGGYRSAIGSYWNAVVDDLRKKVIHRSLDLFNKELTLKRAIKTYEDFQDFVTDYDLIEGAFKIGVIGWEAKRMLNQARETRNVFDGHPASSEPNIFKVLDMITDCNKYVLSQEYPISIIDVDKYLSIMDSDKFEKNVAAIDIAFSDLPSTYKYELANKFYASYLHDSSSSELKSNIQLCFPILWDILDKEHRQQLGKKVDSEIIAGDKVKIEKAIDFILLASNGLRYVSTSTRKMVFEPAIKKMEDSLDQWSEEGKAVKYLERLGSIIPDELKKRYVSCLSMSYIGYNGYSNNWARTDFYSDSAAPVIKRIFARFDDGLTEIFLDVVKSNQALFNRVIRPQKLSRLRELAIILSNRHSVRSDLMDSLSTIIDVSKTEDLIKIIKS